MCAANNKNGLPCHRVSIKCRVKISVRLFVVPNLSKLGSFYQIVNSLTRTILVGSILLFIVVAVIHIIINRINSIHIITVVINCPYQTNFSDNESQYCDLKYHVYYHCHC